MTTTTINQESICDEGIVFGFNDKRNTPRSRFSLRGFLNAAVLVGGVLLVQQRVLAQTPAEGTPPPAIKPDQIPTPLPPGYPSLDEPWTKPKPKKPVPPPPPPVQPPPAEQPGEIAAPLSSTNASAQVLRERNMQVAASGDYFHGEGYVSVPFGYSLAKTFAFNRSLAGANSANRSSDYFGGTVTFSPHPKWYIDLAYQHGSSNGDQDFDLTLQANGVSYKKIPFHFSIDDDWYQAYVRYMPDWMHHGRFSGYIRAGFTYVPASISDYSKSPAFLYNATDSTDDYLGNIGFGLAYRLPALPISHFRWFIVAEAEGYGGRRTQTLLEGFNTFVAVNPQSATIENTLYGGIGRATLRLEYSFSDAFKIFADGGVQGRYGIVTYPGTSDKHELLWGPFVQLGGRFYF